MENIGLVLVLLGGLCGMVFLYAKKRGKQEGASEMHEVISNQDREEAQNELDEKNNSNAWDNLNNTIDDLSER